MLEKIVSGGQTGTDRAALDVALKFEIPYGGWCPKGRLDELGTIPSKYSQLKEIEGEFLTDKDNYDMRTKENIKDSDGTLILIPSEPLPKNIKDGTLITIEHVKQEQKPFLIVNLSLPLNLQISLCHDWLKENNIHILNIAGPRETSSPGIYEKSISFLEQMINS